MPPIRLTKSSKNLWNWNQNDSWNSFLFSLNYDFQKSSFDGAVRFSLWKQTKLDSWKFFSFLSNCRFQKRLHHKKSSLTFTLNQNDGWKFLSFSLNRDFKKGSFDGAFLLSLWKQTQIDSWKFFSSQLNCRLQKSSLKEQV